MIYSFSQAKIQGAIWINCEYYNGYKLYPIFLLFILSRVC